MLCQKFIALFTFLSVTFFHACANPDLTATSAAPVTDESIESTEPKETKIPLKHEMFYLKSKAASVDPRLLSLTDSRKDVFSVLAIMDDMKANKQRICVSMSAIADNAIDLLKRIPSDKHLEFCSGLTVEFLENAHLFDMDNHVDELVKKEEVADGIEYKTAQTLINNQVVDMCMGHMASSDSPLRYSISSLIGLAAVMTSLVAIFV